MPIDLELKKIADDWAEKIYVNICVASSDPTQSLDETETREYNILKEWGWFDHCPIGDDDREIITRLHLSIIKYAKLRWQKDHPPKGNQKPSKWDIVTGGLNRNKVKGRK